MKKTTCSICGKEINKGLLGIGGNAHTLSLAGIDVDCCPQCHRIYDDFAKRNWMRFYTKLQNAFYREHEYADLEKLLTREEVVKYFLAYYQDSTHYTVAESYSGVLVPALDNDLANAAFLTLEGGLGGYVTLDGIAETCTERIQEENQITYAIAGNTAIVVVFEDGTIYTARPSAATEDTRILNCSDELTALNQAGKIKCFGFFPGIKIYVVLDDNVTYTIRAKR